MKVSEILTLKNKTDRLSLLKQNLSRLTDGELFDSRRFYENAHPIACDPDMQDRLVTIKEKVEGKKQMETKSVLQKRTRYKLPYQIQIVETATACVLGEDIDLLLRNADDEKNVDAFNKFTDMWNDDIRMMSTLRDAFKANSVETRCAVYFYIDEQSSRVKSKIYSLKDGYRIWRHKDDNGRMDAVVIEYKKKKIVQSELVSDIQVTEIWTANERIVYEDLDLEPKVYQNPIKKLCFAYFEQDFPEYWQVMDLINAQDYARSRHSDVNIRIGNPSLVVNGNIKTKPRYNEIAPIFEINNKSLDGTSGTATMQYLQLDSAPESVKMEMQNNDRDIYRFTWADFSTLLSSTGFGNMSNSSIKLMFTQISIKIAEKRRIYDDMISRCINILKELAAICYDEPRMRDLKIGFKYNSILPSSLQEEVATLVSALGGGVTSQKQVVNRLSINDANTIDEMKAEGRFGVQDTETETTQEDIKITGNPREDNPPNPEGLNGKSIN